MVEIRPVDWANIETHYQWNNDPELHYFDSDYPHSKESFQAFTQRLKEIDEGEFSTVSIMEIYHSEDKKLIGIVDIHGIDFINNRCFLECTIADKSYRDQGLGTQAFKLAMEYCFNTLNMNKVMSSAFDFNEKWIRILSNLGFKEEGRLREHALKNGSYSDKLMFGMLKAEYKSNKELVLETN
ncbi:MAG: GNAT family N-acetyltransferase [Balneolales bacterium]|nr:GNAT family N-acetyltransferase [Balneolales bacterium]